MNFRAVKHHLKSIYRHMLPVNEPKFIIIGAQKSGTSSLHYYLNQHPQMVGSHPKEIHYFDRDIYNGKSFDLYKKHFRGRQSKLHFETTPSYIYVPDTAAKIHAWNPDVRLVLILRDPVKRAYSAWNHYRDIFQSGQFNLMLEKRYQRDGNLLGEYLFLNRSQFPSFRECIEMELELIEKRRGYEPALLRRGLYIDQLESYWKYFNQNQILIIGFKDFTSNTPAVLERITKFVGADNYNWSKLNYEPKNVHEYQAPIMDDDRKFLEAYYAEANKKLFDRIGKLNW